MDNPCPDPAPDSQVSLDTLSQKIKLRPLPVPVLSNHVYFAPQNCESSIKDFFNNKLYIIGYVGIGIAGVMVI